MATGPTYATFANTLVSKGFDFTFAPGVQPSVCMLYSVPHVANLPSVGALTIKTDGGPTWTFPDCLVEDPRLTAGSSGQFVTLPVKDRRWKWQFGAVYGWFNKPEANGSYTREKTPQQLAGLLLAEMGETGADYSRLPNDTRPEKRWDGATPAAELDALCDELGCVVVLNPSTNLVEIWPVGDGSVLPAGGALGRASSPVLPAMPSVIRVEAGPTLFQATWQCEAVGLDTDGRWKPLTQLSYVTAGGFSGSAALNGFEGYWEGQTYVADGKVLNIRDLAAATVFQNYRLKQVFGWVSDIVPPLLAGTSWQPSTLKDFRFFDELATEELSPVDGGLRPMRANVYVRWARFDKLLPATPIRYPHGFSFDAAENIVSFNEPLFSWGNNTNFSQPADVLFECSFYAGNNGVFHRREVAANTGAANTPTSVVQRPDIQGRIIYFANTTGAATGTVDNFADTEARLDYWKNAELAKYGLQNGGTVTYPGLVAIAPDGLTQQVTWSGGGGRPATTTASQAQRHNRYIKPLDEYRDRLTTKRNEQLLTQLAAGQLLRAIGGGL